jgi:sigma-B regulation protein RsbU (phosphoserine phosphatase)
VLDTANRQIVFTNAGHHPPYLVRRNGGCYQLDAGGPMLGLSSDAAYEEATLDLVPADRLASYSDGLIRAGEKRDNPFGPDRLIGILRLHPLSDAEDLVRFVLNEIDRQNDRSDDITLLMLTLT